MPLMRLYVEKAGRHVTRFQPADRVYSRLPVSSLGALAKCIAVPALAAARMPEGLDSVTASAIPLTGQTACQAITEKLCAKPGETVFIPGGGRHLWRKTVFPLSNGSRSRWQGQDTTGKPNDRLKRTGSFSFGRMGRSWRRLPGLLRQTTLFLKFIPVNLIFRR